MRTVDPELWSKRVRKPGLVLSRPWKFGGPVGLETRLRGSLSDALADFQTHSSSHALKYVSDHRFVRYLYVVLVVVLVLSGCCVMVAMNLEFSKRPPLQVNQLVGSLASRFPFPAVAICSNCIVSNIALNYYTNYLDSLDKNKTYTRAAIWQNLKNFASLITMSGSPQDLEFVKFLYNEHPYFNVTKLMYWLSPNCTSMLKKCTWRGHGVDCERLFATRVTPLGFCCVFNSQYQPEDVDNSPQILELSGSSYGLGVVVNENTNDFAVVRRPTEGFDVLMFDGSEYPLLEGGAVRRYPVARNVSVYFSLTASVQYPAPNLRAFSDKMRGCRIRQFGGPLPMNSYSWCLTECRRRTTVALCNCLPFTLLPNESDRTCSPEHMNCLAKHREKLLYYYPGDDADPGLAEETQDSQQCEHCTPDCARVLHAANAAYVTYYYPEKVFRSTFAAGVSLVNTTVIRIYYDSLNHNTYTVDVGLHWYEAIATLSCQARLLIGCSLVTVSELVYHCTIRWAYHFLRRSQILHTPAQVQ